MTGALTLVVTWLLLVFLNRRTDRGIRERRALTKDNEYGLLLTLMAEFDNAGGRIQEVDHWTGAARKQLRFALLAPFVLTALLVGAQIVFGFPHWIVAAALATWVFIGVMSWAVSGLYGVRNAEGDKTTLQGVLVTIATAVKSSLVALGVLVGWHGASTINSGGWGEGLAAVIVAYLLVTYCYLPVVWVERVSRRKLEVAFAEDTYADSILFLRSFADDDFRLYTPLAALGARYRFIPGRKRFEEFLAAALTGNGRLVGVGKPGERVPTLGAARTYWDQDDWKDAIQSTAGRSQALMVMAGRTPSLAWEVGQLRELALTGKSLILFPPDGLPGTAERHRLIVDALGTPPEHRIPDDLLVTLTAMAFDADGQPIYYTSCGRDWSAYLVTITHFLGALSDKYQFEVAGNMTRAVALADDPFNQAAFMLTERRDPNTARSLAAEAARVDDSPETLVGAAWAQLAIEQDNSGARALLTDAIDRHSDTPLLITALATLGAIEAGDQEPRALLRLRYPTGMNDERVKIRVGAEKLGLRASLVFSRAVLAAQDDWDDWSAEEMLDLATKALAAAEEDGLVTAEARASVWVADALVKLGRVDEARELYEESSGLVAAPAIKMPQGIRDVDPRDVVDDALGGLGQLALKAGGEEDVVAATERLREFRLAQGFRDKAAHSALWLADRHLRQGRPAEAIRWGEIAHSEFSTLGHKTDTARAAVIVAEASNNAEAWESAAAWADTAKTVAELVGDREVAQWAQFEGARADRGLGNDTAALAAFEAIFRAEIDGNRWRARASMIRVGEIDAMRAVALARLAAGQDAEFYAPQAAVRLAVAARVEDDEQASSTLWAEAVDLAVTALTSVDITADARDRAWAVVVESVARAPEALYPALVDKVVAQIPAMQLETLGGANNHLPDVADTGRFDALADLAGQVSRRYEALVAALVAPSAPQLNLLIGLLWTLARGLRERTRSSEVIEVDERMVAYARRVATIDSSRGPSLARCLIKYGYDLGQAHRQREGVAALSEAVGLLDVALAQGTERWSDLCQALTTRADLAGDCGDTETRVADLKRSQSIIDDHRSEDWAAGAQRWLDIVANALGEGEA
jgi:hypothetical protein